MVLQCPASVFVHMFPSTVVQRLTKNRIQLRAITFPYALKYFDFAHYHIHVSTTNLRNILLLLQKPCKPKYVDTGISDYREEYWFRST